MVRNPSRTPSSWGVEKASGVIWGAALAGNGVFTQEESGGKKEREGKRQSAKGKNARGKLQVCK